MVVQGSFREDLFYRLSVVPIRVPPLRERPEDIRQLAEYFLDQFCSRNNFRAKRMDDEVFEILQVYSWPGNARELRNTVERMAILTPADLLTPDSIPLEIRLQPDSKAASLQETRDAAERDRIIQALERCDWNVSAAARMLGVERTNLHKRMRTLGVSRSV
jgi:two-component system nitrogen regulation response regulator NtrX